MGKTPIHIGLVGLGTVGSGVAEILTRHARRLTERVGSPLVLKKVAEKDLKKAIRFGLKKDQICSSWEEIVNDPSISIVVELLGGTTEAKKLVLEALRQGKHVVTANKALLATHGKEILELASKKKLDLLFEAAVGGGIPILRALREGFVANEIRSILAIINGTCNYILSQMWEKGEDFDLVLKKAQSLGYAERDPSFDVEGIDAAHKLSILVSIAYGVYLNLKQIPTEGIRRITAFDMECARRFGYCIKLLAIAKKSEQGLDVRVHPTMISLQNPLANVREAFNAILLEGDYMGRSLLYGKGAGRNPTASAVVGDLVEVARNLLNGVAYTVPPLGRQEGALKKGKLQSFDSLESASYLRFSVVDRPGALAKIAGILSRHSISISSVYQHGRSQGKTVPIVVLTHPAREANIRRALNQIDRLSVVKSKSLRIRIEAD